MEHPTAAAPAPEVPLALPCWPEIAARLAGRRLALFLDYDGTLSPIADRPELALLPEPTRRVLARLAARMPVAILSGRGREDVAALVGLPRLTYAGSHGFDIAGPPAAPGEPPLRHEVDADLPARIAAVAADLQRELQDVPGVLVEGKRFSVAVHYRLVADADLPRLEAAVDRTVRDAAGGLKKSGGKKVFELRPDVSWDKGRALLWLLDRWHLGGPDVAPIYLGDDLTDEDAFAAVAPRGLAVLIAEEPRPTAAAWRLRDPGEALALLEHLAELP